MTLLAIDPGTSQSGFVVLDGGKVVASGVLPNHETLVLIADHHGDLAIEMVASFGMAVGKEVFETVRWIGRMQQAFERPEAVQLVYRRDVKMHLCGSAKAKDANVRQAIIDRFGPGKDRAIGKKATPGPLYGVTSHAWAALAVALTTTESQRW